MNFLTNKITKKIKLLIITVISILIIISLYIFRSPESVVKSYITNIHHKNTLINYFNLDNNCKDYTTYKDYSEYIDSLKNDTLIDIIDVKLIEDETQDLFKRYECKIALSNNDTTFAYYTVNTKYYINNICDIECAINNVYNLEDLKKRKEKFLILHTLDPFNVKANFYLSENDESGNFLKRALKYSPEDPISYYVKALRFVEEEPEISIENFNIALEKGIKRVLYKNGFSAFYTNNSIPYYNLGIKDSAESLIKKALDIDSSLSHTWWIKGINEDNLQLKIKYLKKACYYDNKDEFRTSYYLSYAQSLIKKYKSDVVKQKNDLFLCKKYTVKVLNIEIENEEARTLLKEIRVLIK